MLDELGRCVRESGRPHEAEEYFERVLAMENAKLPPDSLEIGVTLSEMGRCVREAGQPLRAEAYLRRALEIVKSKLGSNDVQASGECVVCVKTMITRLFYVIFHENSRAFFHSSCHC